MVTYFQEHFNCDAYYINCKTISQFFRWYFSAFDQWFPHRSIIIYSSNKNVRNIVNTALIVSSSLFSKSKGNWLNPCNISIYVLSIAA